MTRVIVAGCRDYNNLEKIYTVLYTLLPKYEMPIEIVSGGASGVDSIAEEYAKQFGIPLQVFNAEWDNLDATPCLIKINYSGKRYNALAGFNRNTTMAEYAKEDNGVLIAFWDGYSHGTKDMINKARKHDLQIHIESIQR